MRGQRKGRRRGEEGETDGGVDGGEVVRAWSAVCSYSGVASMWTTGEGGATA